MGIALDRNGLFWETNLQDESAFSKIGSWFTDLVTLYIARE
jgi:hypothetical protein